ncbi:MAG: sensor histidine kinase [Acidimicrobiales bacterium]
MTKVGGPATTDTPDELVEAVVRLMPDPAVVVDGTGMMVAANVLAERLFGATPGGLTGLAIEMLVPQRFRGRHVGHRAGYIERPTRRPMGAGLSLVAVRRDGREFPVEISLAPLGGPDRPLTLAAIRDMTVQRVEWENLARLAAVVASSDDAILSFDLAGAITSCNPASEGLLGYSDGELVGRSFWRLVPAELRHDIEERMARIRAGMRVRGYDTRRVRRDGGEVDVSESMSIVPDASGAPGGFSVVMRDITDRKAAEYEMRVLLTETQRRERWLGTLSELRLALLGGAEQQQWMDLITTRVCELLDADGSLIAVPSSSDPDALRVTSTNGIGLVLEVGDEVPMDLSLAGRAFRSGISVVSEDYRADSPAPEAVRDDVPIGPIVLAPMSSSIGSAGVLVVSRIPGRMIFGPEDVQLVESVAQQAGLGIDLAHAQEERAQFVVLADRERIARDLHDHVVQRLFAVGMSLQAATHFISDERALERIEDSVEELDATIRGVRSTIFSLELQATEHVATSTRSRILDVASLAAPALGFQPMLHFDGPIDTRVPTEMVHDILAVVRESLSNTARHAQASRVDVHVGVHEDTLAIEVVDDGKGAGDRTRSSGLTNLRVRAEQRSGTIAIGEGRKGRGTRLVWQVPIE